MGRRQLARRDKRIEQGQRRDEFFARLRRKGSPPGKFPAPPETEDSEPIVDQEPLEDSAELDSAAESVDEPAAEDVEKAST